MLHYLKNGNSANQIIFIHGNSQSAKAWNNVFAEEQLNTSYTLVAVDLPGHGESFRSSAPEKEYSLKGLSKHALYFIKEFEANPYIIVANSLGANIVGEIAMELNNCQGILITGSCAIGKGLTLEDIFLPNPNSAVSFIDKPTDEQLNLLVEDTVELASSENKELIKREYLNTDSTVRTQLANTIATQDYTDELQNLEDSKIPLAFVFGKHETLCNIHHLDKIQLPKWKNQVILIENSRHFSHLDQPTKLGEIISEFAQYCFN